MTALKITRVVSTGNAQKWAQALCEENTCFVLEVHGTDEEPAVKTGESITHSLLLKVRNHPVENLEQVKHILNLVKEKKHIKSLLLAVFNDNVVYIGQHGEGEVLIKRGDKILPLIKKAGALSGHIKQDDFFFLVNKSTEETIGEEILKKIAQETSEEKLEEAFLPYSLNPENSGLGIIIAKVDVQKTPPLPPYEHPTQDIQKEDDTAEEELKEELPGKKFTAPNLSDLKTKLSVFIKEKLLQEEDINQERTDPAKKKTKLILIAIAVILLLLFAISIGFGINSQFGKVKEEDYQKKVELISHQYDEAVSLTDLNPKRSRDLLFEAQDETKKLLALLPDNSIEAKNIQEWQSKINNQIVVASKVYKQDEAPTLFDLSIIRDGAEGSDITLFEDRIAVLDEKDKRLYTLTKEGKQGEVIAGPDVTKNAKTVSMHGGNIYIANDDGIIKVDAQSGVSENSIENDDEWGTKGPVGAYAGNLYLLDKSKNQIWKYIATEDGFTDKDTYLEEDVQVDLSEAKSIAIDGSIWVLAGNEVIKLTQGRIDVYTMTDGIEENMKLDALATNEDAENIYLLDSSKGRVTVFTKEGKYKETYESPSLKGAQSLIVSEPDKKILVLNGSKIFAVDIK